MAADEDSPRIIQRLEAAFGRADAASRGWLGVLRRTLEQFAQARGPQAAAALSYYSLFSLFPLAVLLITVMGWFVEPAQVEAFISLLANRMLPDAQGVEELVLDALASVFASRGQVTVISLIALLWAASGVFTNLTFNVDLAWSEDGRPSPITARLVGLLMVVIVYIGLVLLLMTSATLGVLSMLPVALMRWLGFSGQIIGDWMVAATPLVVSVLVFLGLYKWVPHEHVPWRVAFWSALFAAVGAYLLNLGFTWYLGSGLARYEYLYGPLTAIIVLMVWFYLTVVVILLGAHFGAALVWRGQGGAGISRPR
jgi:membrane protein